MRGVVKQQVSLAILSDEFARTMQLCGTCTVADIKADLLFDNTPHRSRLPPLSNLKA